MSDRINGSNINDASNSATTANSLNGSGINLITGSVGGSDVSDFYKFIAANTGTATLSLTGLSADLELGLWGSSGTLLEYSSEGDTRNENIIYSVTAGQTYYVQVKPYYSYYYSSVSSNYSLNVSLPVTLDRINGSIINDAGNSATTANNLNSSGANLITGSVGGSDASDYYKFVAANTGTVTLSLTGLSSDINLGLWNSYGQKIAYSGLTSTRSEGISYSVTAGETYYVQVDPSSSAGSNYNLNVSLPRTSDNINGSNINDASNSAITAHSLKGSGANLITGSVGGSDASDYYKFVAANTGDATLSLTGLSADIDLILWSSDGTELAYPGRTGTSSESINYSVTAGQAYYVQVKGFLSASSDYNLNVSLPVTLDRINGSSINDAGNSATTANSLNGSGTSLITGSVGGSDASDYYKFVVANTGLVTLSLTGLNDDLDLGLWNSYGERLAYPGNSGTSNESINNYAVTAGQTYYVQVDPYNSAGSNYNLNVSLVTPQDGGYWALMNLNAPRDVYNFFSNAGITSNMLAEMLQPFLPEIQVTGVLVNDWLQANGQPVLL